jgi:hypothetical protein
MSITKSSNRVLTRGVFSLFFNRIVMATVVAVLTTIFVLAAFSAPQNENAPANGGQTQTATD